MVKSLEIAGDEMDPAREVARMTKPYRTASKKDWQGFKEFYEGNPEALFHPLTINKDTAFHIAASGGDKELLQDLLRMVPDLRIRHALTGLKDEDGNTALHEVATTDSVDAAKFMVHKLRTSTDGTYDMEEKDISREMEQLFKVKNNLGETPLYRAAALGKTTMVHYLAREIQKVSGNISGHFYRYDPISILHIAVLGQHFDIAIWLLKYDKGLGKGKEMNGLTCFHLIALMPSAFRSTSPMGMPKKLVYWCLPTLDDDNDDEAQLPSSEREDIESGKSSGDRRQSNKRSVFSRTWSAIWRGLIEGCPSIKKIWEEKEKHELALKLVKLLVKHDTSWKESYNAEQDCTVSLGLGKGGKKPPETEEGNYKATSSENSRSSPEVPLLLAARTGIVEIIEEILNEYPQAIDHISENEQNILHLAILHRRHNLFKLIKNMVMQLDKLASKIDNSGNTILHQVADIKHYSGGTRPGPALQFQEELLWFKRVKKIMPSHYVMHRNNNRITAEDLFEEQHKEQLDNAQNWIKETSQSCSTVAVLVATVVFAAAYTVPGGSNDLGLPNFLHTPLFLLFTVTDVVSLASSLTSVVMFLSILTSSLEQHDFLESLPRKLTVGFAFLFLSVMTTMITFTASLLLIIRLKRTLTSALIYTTAFIPVAVFAFMQFPLYLDFLSIFQEFFKDIWKALPGRKKRN